MVTMEHGPQDIIKYNIIMKIWKSEKPDKWAR